ncbi:MAG TPA: sulfite exporter TauE/SafE family protein [Blastocatellia bacterium]|nr:sulfite exporter TauE/SafE family protein [Blastocatellia bacterium]
MTVLQGSLLFGSALIAGAINSVAGGGTLVSFPTLVWTGVPPIIANATNTLAMTPGACGSAIAYRRELVHVPRKYLVLLVPSLIGSLVGGYLLKKTPPDTFKVLVPYLILFATILFMMQSQVRRLLKTDDGEQQEASTSWLIGAGCYQFGVAVYGGYFGAGIGILMLAALGMLGLRDIHQMNGLKNIFGVLTNGAAAVYFVFTGLINWPAGILMAIGAIVGGYGGAGIARRLGQQTIRRLVIAIGFGMAISLFFKR